MVLIKINNSKQKDRQDLIKQGLIPIEHRDFYNNFTK